VRRPPGSRNFTAVRARDRRLVGWRKSTLLQLTGGIPAAESGVIRVGETEVTALSRRQLAGYRSTAGFLLLADEPAGALDSATGSEIIELLLSLNGDHSAALLIAAHDQAIARHCQRSSSSLTAASWPIATTLFRNRALPALLNVVDVDVDVGHRDPEISTPGLP